MGGEPCGSAPGAKNNEILKILNMIMKTECYIANKTEQMKIYKLINTRDSP